MREFLLNERYFRYYYIITLFLSLFCVVEYGFSFMAQLGLVWAFVLFAVRIYRAERIPEIENGWMIAIFLLASLVTAIIHIDSNFMSNLLQIYHAAVFMLMLYGMKRTDGVSVEAESVTVYKTLCILTTLAAAAGLLIFAFPGEVQMFGYVLGTYKGTRFTGLYTNPNLAAFAGIVGMICTHMLYHKTYVRHYLKPDIPRWFYVLSMMLNFATLILSDSNAGTVFFAAYGAMILFLRLLEKNDRVSLKAFLGFAIILGGVFLIVVGLRFMGEKGFAMILDESIGRSFHRDLTSGRFQTWHQALDIFREYPLMGIGRANILDYGDVYLEHGFEYFDIHNGYLTILLSNGMLGFGIFAFFGLSTIMYLWKQLVGCRQQGNRYLPYYLAALLAYCIYAFFERTLMYDNSFMVAIFWLILGYAMNAGQGDDSACKRKIRQLE